MAQAEGSAAVSVRDELTDLFKAALASAFPGVDETPLIAGCNNAKNGDYQCNNAMGLFGKLKGTEGAPKAAPADGSWSSVGIARSTPISCAVPGANKSVVTGCQWKRS